jgi:hypothetical protein
MNIKRYIINPLKYITFLFYNTKISSNNAESRILIQGVPKKEDESITPLFIGRF